MHCQFTVMHRDIELNRIDDMIIVTELLSLSVFKDLINQGRQKVLEATNALKSVPRESLEDIIAQVVSDRREGDPLQ